MRPVSLYVHVPFCRRRCQYCTFYHVPTTDPRLEAAFLRALAAEYEQAEDEIGEAFFFPTVFIGGGTPSVLDRRSIEEIIDLIAPRIASDGAELTIEVNPEDVNEVLLDMLVRSGFNRISAGVQSMSGPAQKSLGRCEPDVNHRALGQIKNRFANFNVDLLLGVPGGTPRKLMKTLKRIEEFNPPHLSVYCLEPGGVLGPSSNGFFESVDQEQSADEYLFVCRELEERGYHHYEVSNFARPGFECRHNLVYWRGGEYLGIGPSAHTYLAGERFSNIASIEAYTRAQPMSLGAIRRHDHRDHSQRRLETAMLALRTSEGLAVEDLHVSGSVVDDLVGERLARIEQGRIVVNDRGYLVLDEIVQRLCRQTDTGDHGGADSLTAKESNDRLNKGF
ncbi:MAG: radical SAM family heme chaperone HemW [Candidatus Latescibacterota bacterium]|nr:MAG: radical SAM family heme chaperone HemW [Candidatus Latescibacterota bacterium]